MGQSPSPVAVRPAPAAGHSSLVTQSQEQLLWTGRPSQIVNLGSFILCGLLSWLAVPIFLALWEWLRIKCVTYELTNQRFRITHGVLSRRTDELELYRVKDT